MWLGIFKKVSFSIDEIQLELQVSKEQKKTNKLALITKNTKKNEIKSKFKKNCERLSNQRNELKKAWETHFKRFPNEDQLAMVHVIY